MVERIRLTVLTSVLLASLVACGDGSLEPLPLQISMQASPATAGPGEVVSFVVTVQGGNLFGVDIDYGDTSTDQQGAGGARTARLTFRHAYSVVGTYQVRGRVTDAIAGEREATVEVRVQ